MDAAASASSAVAAPPAAVRGRCIVRLRLPLGWKASSASAAVTPAAAASESPAAGRAPPVAASASSAAPPAAAPTRCIARIRLPRAWTAEEDARLERLAKENGFRNWHRVARQMPGRSPSFCRYRWRHHLARHVYHRPFTATDDEELRRLVVRFGPGGRWKEIGRAVYGRTSRVMKRRWKELLRKKNSGDRKIYCPPALPSEEDHDQEGMELDETVQQDTTTRCFVDDDVLASGFASCSLSTDAVDPRAGSLALGFACMAV